MNMKMTAAALAALLLAGSVRADDAKPDATARESVMTFLKHLKQALTESAVASDRKNERTAAVAAVRGAAQTSDQADPDVPTLKGDAAAQRLALRRAQDAQFEKGLDLVLAGKTADGIKALEAFKAKNPKYRDIADVQQAIDKAKSIPAAAPAEEKPAASASVPTKN
ncbi:MAG: hypothetical protein HKL90_10305 [Elusimicrobia bacterium]|nr:hypothetical protein [Elusimicrobiota bacterium]